ncbi:MAG: hypothetical protein EBT22_06595 [Chloroflexi bacterium]|nr:hypothetical protein [Chloroflexota bacterium]
MIAHTPLLLNADRGKISKRKHPWANMRWFQDEGFLPEAVLNYLGNLIAFVPDAENPQQGVARELFGFAEISEHFQLGSIGPSGKVVDLDRLDWLNGQYIRRMALDELARRVGPFMTAAGLDTGNPIFMGALALEQERLKRLSEAPSVLSIFFREEAYAPEALVPAPFRDLAIALDLTTGKQRGQLFGVVRVASTGRTATPPLFDTMAILGAETILKRLAHARLLLAGLGV